MEIVNRHTKPNNYNKYGKAITNSPAKFAGTEIESFQFSFPLAIIANTKDQKRNYLLKS